MKKHVAILTGGKSSERKVALWSAENVQEGIGSIYDIQVFDFPQDLDKFLSARHDIEIAIPIFHGPWGEDGVIQGFLNVLGIPFLFSDVEAHAIGMNKMLAKAVIDLQSPNAITVKRGEIMQYQKPVIIKPRAGGSTLGMTKAIDEVSFKKAIEHAFEFADEVMIEDFVKGREFTAGTIEEAGQVIALPIVEIIPPDGFFDFDSKYIEGKMAKEICPAEIDNELKERLQQAAIKAHNAINASHVSRSDFIVDKNDEIWFLEINTIPGLTKNSLIPKALRASGRSLASVFCCWLRDLEKSE